MLGVFVARGFLAGPWSHTLFTALAGAGVGYVVVRRERRRAVRYAVATLCLATEGLPMSGTDAFDPPGTFALGHTGKATAKRTNTIWNTSDVTKNFTLKTKRGRNGHITGSLHADFSFLMILYTYPISARPYVCTGDTTFQAQPKR